MINHHRGKSWSSPRKLVNKNYVYSYPPPSTVCWRLKICILCSKEKCVFILFGPGSGIVGPVTGGGVELDVHISDPKGLVFLRYIYPGPTGNSRKGFRRCRLSWQIGQISNVEEGGRGLVTISLHPANPSPAGQIGNVDEGIKETKIHDTLRPRCTSSPSRTRGTWGPSWIRTSFAIFLPMHLFYLL